MAQVVSRVDRRIPLSVGFASAVFARRMKSGQGDRIMAVSAWTDADTVRACQLWEEYQRRNDVASRVGQTAGIDPDSGRVWFGDSAADIWQQRQSEGIDAPFYCVRVGRDYYLRKGRRR
jgi:hypothetical protein